MTPPNTTAEPSGGTYNSVTVTLTANEPATIYYTIDGTDPTTESNVFNPDSPIQIPADEDRTIELRFFTIDTAGNQEDIKTETYVID